MSGASARRSALARQEKAQKARLLKVQHADIAIQRTQMLLNYAGNIPKGRWVSHRHGPPTFHPLPTSALNPNYTGPIRNRDGSVSVLVSTPVIRKGNRTTNRARISIPPASAIPSLTRQLAVQKAQKKVIQAQNEIEGLSIMPINIQVGSTRSGSSGRNRKARAVWTQTQTHDVGLLTRKHSANTRLWSAQKEVATASGSTFNTPPPKAPFAIQGSGEKLATLSAQSGFDVGLQLKKTNERFGLDLNVNHVTADPFSGGLVGEASNIFSRNRKIDKLKTELDIVKPNTVPLDSFSGYDTLFERRDSIVGQQKSHLDSLNLISDPDLRIARIENDLPQFNQRAGEIDGLITNLEGRIKTTRATRKPAELLSATGSLKSFNIRDLVSRRNDLTKIRNEKALAFENIKDPALRQVTLEQDIPQFDQRIGALDSDIQKSVSFAESRQKLDIGIVNAPTKRRGRQPKTFDVTIGSTTQTFKRNTRGARKAQTFFQEQRALKQTEIDKISDPIQKAVAIDQDIGVIDLGIKAQKVQSKVLKAEKRANLESLNIGGASGSAGFMPFTPSDTPTGKLNIPSIPKRRGVPKIFDQLQSPSRRRGRGRTPSNSLDIGAIFGQSERIPKKQNGQFDFF